MGFLSDLFGDISSVGKSIGGAVESGVHDYGNFIDSGVRDLIPGGWSTLAKFTPFAPAAYAYDTTQAIDNKDWLKAALSAFGGANNFGGGDFVGSGLSPTTTGSGGSGLYGFGQTPTTSLSTTGLGNSNSFLPKSLSDFTGITNPIASQAINGAGIGAVTNGLQGNNILKGALQGGLQGGIQGGINYGMKNMFDDMPDVGTLGGTLQDENGESSVTSGGITPTQTHANILSVPSSGNDSGSSLSSPVNSFVNTVLGAQNPSGQGTNYAGLFSNLYGMYNASQQRKKFAQQQDSLAGMFSQNSPYAQQLQQTLDRKDAAAGRRSQYGQRTTQLQAMLAEANARSAPQQMQLQSAQNSLSNMFGNNLLQFGTNAYKQAPQITSDLSRLFSNFGG